MDVEYLCLEDIEIVGSNSSLASALVGCYQTMSHMLSKRRTSNKRALRNHDPPKSFATHPFSSSLDCHILLLLSQGPIKATFLAVGAAPNTGLLTPKFRTTAIQALRGSLGWRLLGYCLV